MNSEVSPSVEIVTALCRELRRVAKGEEDRAAAEAADTPYWSACPPSVLAHRAAARALRADAERLEAQAHPRPRPLAS